MRFLPSFALLAGAASAASSWSFSDGAVEISSKSTVSTNYIFADVQETVQLGPSDKLKVSLTTKDGSKAKRPHQAFLMLKEKNTGLEAPYVLSLKESGKGTVELVGHPTTCVSPQD
jgi:oligosaccharyltransferase complex subunit delta (ribophorin II)